MFKTLREENESVVKLKGICADGKLPKGLLLEGKAAMENELADKSGMFQSAKKQDAMNEAMPQMMNEAYPGQNLFKQSKNSTTGSSVSQMDD